MQLFETIKASVKVIVADIGQGFFLIHGVNRLNGKFSERELRQSVLII